MHFKHSPKFFFVSVVAIILSFMACKKEESTTGPTPGPQPVSKGSGTVGATISINGGASQNLNFSGSGQWPPSGTGVAAGMSSDGKNLDVVGYRQTSSKTNNTAGARFTFIAIMLRNSSAITVGNFTGEVVAIAGVDIDTANVRTQGFFAVSGTLNIDSVTSTRVVASFSGVFVNAAGDTMVVTNGTFAVNYVSGIFLDSGDNNGGGGGTGSGSGSMSFNSDRGNFSATGAFDTTSSPEGVGAWRYQASGYDNFIITAYKVNSPTDIAISTLLFYRSGTLAAGTFAFPTAVSLGYIPHYNPSDTSSYNDGYFLMSGNATISTLTSSTGRGSFSGNGVKYNNFSETIAVSSGSFDVNYVTGRPSKTVPTAVRDAVEKMYQKLVR